MSQESKRRWSSSTLLLSFAHGSRPTRLQAGEDDAQAGLQTLDFVQECMTGQARDLHSILGRPGETNRAIGGCCTAEADKDTLGSVLLLHPQVARHRGFVCCQQAILGVGKQGGIGRTTGMDGSRTG